jgi:hypothetical protein
MQAIMSAICARAGHELCACFLSFPCSMLGHAPVTARASRFEKAAALTIAIRPPKGVLATLAEGPRFVARVILPRNCRRLCKIAQINVARER